MGRLYAEDVETIAARASSEIIGADGPERTSWGTLEIAMSDPDGALVRVGEPLRS